MTALTQPRPTGATGPPVVPATARASIELYWLPLGAGGWFVRCNGRIYEAAHALLERRRPLELYHSALVVRVPEGRFVVEDCWPVASPRLLSDDPLVARRLLDVVGRLPRAVWGRDELGTGEMWNSNSVIAWVLARSGLPTDGIRAPTGGRAPGWAAGLVTARRQLPPGPPPPAGAARLRW
jgi:hypothetical protein